MRNVHLGLAVFLALAFISMALTTLPSSAEDDLSEERWTRGMSPVVLNASIEIGEDTRLVIEAGVEVRLAEDVGIQVKGVLSINGTETEPVHFVPDTVGAIGPSMWADLRLHAKSAGREHLIRWAVFKGADAGLLVASTNARVEDCTFDSCRYGILARAEAVLDVTRTTFFNCSALGLEWETRATGVASECIFDLNRVAVYCDQNASPVVEDCTFTGNYHHLSFSRGSNATVRRCHLSGAIAEHLECYEDSSPLLEDLTIADAGDAMIVLRERCRPRFVEGTPVSSVRVETLDDASYAISLSRITVEVSNDEGDLLEGANVTISGASGQVFSRGTTGPSGRTASALMSLYTVNSTGAQDAENPHRVVVEWKGHSQTYHVDPRDVDRDRVLALELVTSQSVIDPEAWYILAFVLVLMGIAFIVGRRLWRGRG
jgi:hypothetical protein